MQNFSYADLAALLKRPELYERTAEKFWTDPHIATQMLEAHLDPDADGASRSPEFINRSADWVASLLPASAADKTGGRQAALLDIGCGPGLYTKLFAQRGLSVTGMDFSENSIAHARRHDPDSEYILHDYLSMDFDSMFDIATLIYCDYGALVPQERRGLLDRIHKALKPGGLFLLDVFTPRRGKGEEDSATWEACPDGGFWSAKPHLSLEAEYYYGETAQGSRHVIIEEGGARCFNLWNCYFTKQSLQDETSGAGFSLAGFYADVSGQPYSADSETLCAVLKKPA